MRAAIVAILTYVVRIFFRHIDLVGTHRVPKNSPVIFVLNHPNALIDPILPLCFAPRPVSFLAKAPLFNMFLVGIFVRSLRSLPVFRAQDGPDTAGQRKENTRRNRATMDAARDLLASGNALAIFPEGISHAEAALQPLKTGAARIAIGASAVLEKRGDKPVKVVPVGIHYTDRTTFRSSALLVFGEPLDVPKLDPDLADNLPPKMVKSFTRAIRGALSAVMLQAENHDALRLAALAERIFSAGQEQTPTPEERFAVHRRILDGYEILGERPEVHSLVERMLAYEAETAERGLGLEHIEPRHLRPWPALVWSFKQTFMLLSIGVLGVPGMLLHLPAYRAIHFIALRQSGNETDMVATVKVLAATLFFPLTWALTGIVVWQIAGGMWGGAAAAVSPLLGLSGVWLRERLDHLGTAINATWLFLTRRRTLRRLTSTRQAICAELLALADSLP